MPILTMMLAGCAATQVSTPGREEGREIMASNVSFDAKTGEIRYTLPEPALVRVRVGLRNGGPLLRNLVDWERREAGAQVETWNRRDATGRIDFGRKSDYMVALSCIPVDPKQWPRHSKVTSGFRKSPRFEISFPDSAAAHESDSPTVAGTAPVRITVDPADQKWLAESKYEIAMYIDDAFLMEDEEGTNPFTYQLNTKNLNNGPHTITVNIVTFDGEAGTESVRVVVNN